MNRASTIFLQFVLVLIAIGFLAFLLWEPQIEGRNAHATQFQIYFNDPFLVWAYTASIAVFAGFYQAFRLLGSVRQGTIFSQASVKAFRTIRYCAMIVIGFLVVAEAWLFLVERGKDDIAGGVAMGLMIIVVSSVIAASASMFERIVRNAVDIAP